MMGAIRFTWHSLVFTLLAASILFSLGEQQAQAPSGDATRPEVAFFAHFQDGKKAPGQDESGLLIVAWTDGLVVFAHDPTKPGKAMMAGRIAPDEVRTVLEDLKSDGFFDGLPGGGIIPDGAYWTVRATREGKVALHTCWWADAFEDRSSVNVQADAAARKFAKMWTLARQSIAFARPREFGPLESRPEDKKRFDDAIASRELRR